MLADNIKLERSDDRREERRLAREAKRAERAAAREERKARWAARTEWLRDPRVKQVIGVLALSSGAFMVLAGVSAILVGGEDIRLIASGTETPAAATARPRFASVAADRAWMITGTTAPDANGQARYGAEARPWSARGAHCGKSRRSTSASTRWSTSSCRQFRKLT